MKEPFDKRPEGQGVIYVRRVDDSTVERSNEVSIETLQSPDQLDTYLENLRIALSAYTKQTSH